VYRLGPQSDAAYHHRHDVGKFSLYPHWHRRVGPSHHADYRVHWQSDSVSVEVQDQAEAFSSRFQHGGDGSVCCRILLHLSRRPGGHAELWQSHPHGRDCMHLLSHEYHSGRWGDRHHGEEIPYTDLVRLLFLVLPLLLGRSIHSMDS
jgi:hypothetical protein